MIGRWRRNGRSDGGAPSRNVGAITANASVAVVLAKEAVRDGYEVWLYDGFRLETDLSVQLRTTEDVKEGARAFVEKRAPQWSGK